VHKRNIAIEADNVTKWLSEAPDAGKAIRDILMDLAEEIPLVRTVPGSCPGSSMVPLRAEERTGQSLTGRASGVRGSFSLHVTL
jgi:hypothetical protein